jgi:hypothetical protein
MTRISKKSAYPIKLPVQGDYFVGSDSEQSGKTVNFGFDYAVNLINKINGTLIVNYMFKTDSNIPLAVLTEGHFLSQDNNTDVNSITTLFFNKTNLQGDDLNELFLFLKDNSVDFNIKLQDSTNLLNAIYLKINSVVSYSDYFVFNVVIYKTNASLSSLIDSKIYFFNFEVNEKGATGPQGLQGIQGPQGIIGLTGEKGDAGTQGIQGIQGNEGAQGLRGFDGPIGTQGIQGVQGLIGETGSQGSKGDVGLNGTDGLSGADGIQGVKGDTGLQGVQGFTGDIGAQGIQGIQGVNGDAGLQGIRG